MKKYTCNKHCIIGGKQFFAGDEIPGELIEPMREQTLLKYGLFSVTDAQKDSVPAKHPKGKKTGENDKAPENPSEAPTIGDDDEQKPDTGTEQKPGEKVQE